jgi:XRE family transcriptional regulator, aerobic/anaerobic benzoate catabolism transcriptional regulator
LIGVLNAGKSTVGPLLSRQLKIDFVELDHEIEDAAGMPLADLFATHGEGYYRTLEHEALARLFATSRGGVFAPGGSVVTDPESWNLVKQRCFTIWLHATPEELMKRTKRKGNQRLLNRPSVMADLKSLLARREPLYAESKLTIKTTGKAPAKITQEILNALPSGI